MAVHNSPTQANSFVYLIMMDKDELFPAMEAGGHIAITTGLYSLFADKRQSQPIIIKRTKFPKAEN